MVRFFALAGNFCLAIRSFHIFDSVLVNQSELFVNLSIKGGVTKLPQSFFLVEVGPPNNN